MPIGIHCPPLRQGDVIQGLYGVVVVIRVSQQRPTYVAGHWQRNKVP